MQLLQKNGHVTLSFLIKKSHGKKDGHPPSYFYKKNIMNAKWKTCILCNYDPQKNIGSICQTNI